jgi:hypothetical protein
MDQYVGLEVSWVWFNLVLKSWQVLIKPAAATQFHNDLPTARPGAQFGQ